MVDKLFKWATVFIDEDINSTEIIVKMSTEEIPVSDAVEEEAEKSLLDDVEITF